MANIYFKYIFNICYKHMSEIYILEILNLHIPKYIKKKKKNSVLHLYISADYKMWVD